MIVKLSYKNQKTFYTGKITFSLLQQQVKTKLKNVRNSEKIKFQHKWSHQAKIIQNQKQLQEFFNQQEKKKRRKPMIIFEIVQQEQNQRKQNKEFSSIFENIKKESQNLRENRILYNEKDQNLHYCLKSQSKKFLKQVLFDVSNSLSSQKDQKKDQKVDKFARFKYKQVQSKQFFEKEDQFYKKKKKQAENLRNSNNSKNTSSSAEISYQSSQKSNQNDQQFQTSLEKRIMKEASAKMISSIIDIVAEQIGSYKIKQVKEKIENSQQDYNNFKKKSIKNRPN